MAGSKERRSEKLYKRFRECIVEVRVKGTTGTGFFVAPGCVVTSNHLLPKETNTSVTIDWQGQCLEAEVSTRHYSRIAAEGETVGWQDLALLRVDLSTHPCALLGTSVAIRDPVYSFGFSRPGGESVTIVFEGPVGQGLLKLKEGQVRPGMSGAPVLNERTGEVVGVLQLTRGRGGSLGGYATPTSTLFECERDLRDRNALYHQENSQWRDLLPKRFWLRAMAWLWVSLLGGGVVASSLIVRDRVLKASVVILPFASSVRGEEQASEDLTKEFLEEWNRTTGIPVVDSRLVGPLAATLSYRGSLCAPTDVLETVRKLTGAAYVVNGSFKTFKNRQPRTLSVCFQSTCDHRRVDFVRKEWVPETKRNTLGEIAAGFGNSVEVPFATVLALREGRVTSDQEAVQEYLEGMLHFQRYELKRAVNSFRNALGRDPRFYLAHDGLARVWQELGHDGEAADEARKALILFGDRRDDERQLGLLRASVLGTQGKWNLVAYIYRTLWKIDKSDFVAAMRLAEAQNLAGLSEDALSTIVEIRERRKSMALEIPVELDARLDLEESIAYHKTARFSQQGTAAESAIEKVGLDHDLLEARALYLRCDALVSQSPPAWSELCQRAKRSFYSGNDVINWAKFLQLEARLLLEQRVEGETDRGLQERRTNALFIDRRVSQLFLQEGFLRGYIEQASNLADSLLEQSPPQKVEAEIQCDEAVKAARKGRSLTLPAVLVNCAYFPTMNGNFEKAREMYESASSVARETGNALLEAIALGNLGYIQHGLHREKEALGLYQKSVELSERIADHGPDYGETLIRYARLLSDLGRRDEAESYYKKGLDESEGITGEELTEFLESMGEVLGESSAAWRRIVNAHHLQQGRVWRESPPVVSIGAVR